MSDFTNTCEGIELVFHSLSFLAFWSKWRRAEGVTPLPLCFWDVTIPGEHSAGEITYIYFF